jgi:O-antigen/teichoic acid export membrane protein
VGSGDVILRILVVGALFRAWRMPAFFVVVGLGKHRLFGVMTLVTAVSSLLLGAVLLARVQLGVVGVAIGFAVPEVLISTLVIGPYCSRAVGLTLAAEVRRSVVPAATAMAPLLAMLAVARYTFSPRTIAELLVLVSVLAIPTVAGWWWLGCTVEERIRFIRMLPVGRIRSGGDSET